MQKPDSSAITAFNQNTTADILNAIKNDKMTSPVYKAAVPDIEAKDIATLREMGNVLNQFPELQNEFANALIGRIALTLIKSKSFLNPYAMFKRGILELGEIIQEVYVDLVKPQAYNPALAEKEWMKRELPKILANYYKINSKAFYKITVEPAEINRAFTTWNGVTDLIGRIVGRLVDSMQYDEFMMTKYLIAKHILVGDMAVITTGTTPSEDVIAFKSVSNALLFPSTDFNPAGVINVTPTDNQYLFISGKYAATLDVEVLAKAFNMERAQFLGHQVMYDSLSNYDWGRMKELFSATDTILQQFTADEKKLLDSVVGVVIDVDAFLIFDDLIETRQQENGQGLYWQHWLHSWKTFAMSPFENQVVFVPEIGEVIAITITPETINGVRGKSVFFYAKVTGTGIFSNRVEWSVNSNLSIIDSSGALSIAPDETADTLTVTATIGEVSATATVKL